MVRKNRNAKTLERKAVDIAVATAIALIAAMGPLSQAQEALAGGGGGGRSGITEECSEAECHVSMAGSTFTPDTLKIRLGTTVVWTNMDKMIHTVTNIFPKDGKDSRFDSGLSSPIGGGEKWEHKFDTAGTFDYFCQIHPRMAGQIIVTGEPNQEFVQLPTMLLMAVGVFGAFASVVAATRIKNRR